MNEHMTYSEFRAQYETQHPASVPKLEYENSPYPKWLKLATLTMFLAAALLSAVHTIPVVFESIPESAIISREVRTIAANGSVIAFELGLLLSAFLMVSKSSLRLAWILLGTMFLGTLVANVYSISQTKEPDIGAIAVTIIFGMGIPIIALSAGKLYVNIYTTEAALERKAKETYREAMKQWDSVILGAYTKYLKEFEKRETSQNFMNFHELSSTQEPIHENSRTTQEAYKPRVKLHDIAKQVRENGDEHLSVHELMEKYDISQGGTTKVREILRSSNGHLN